MFTLVTFGILATEQAIVRNAKLKTKALWIAELLLIAIIVVIIIVSGFELSVG